MVVRDDPLIPPSLFRRRAFTVINISTFLIYGALYVSQFLVSLFVQGVLGYTAFAAALKSGRTAMETEPRGKAAAEAAALAGELLAAMGA